MLKLRLQRLIGIRALAGLAMGSGQGHLVEDARGRLLGLLRDESLDDVARCEAISGLYGSPTCFYRRSEVRLYRSQQFDLRPVPKSPCSGHTDEAPVCSPTILTSPGLYSPTDYDGILLSALEEVITRNSTEVLEVVKESVHALAWTDPDRATRTISVRMDSLASEELDPEKSRLEISTLFFPLRGFPPLPDDHPTSLAVASLAKASKSPRVRSAYIDWEGWMDQAFLAKQIDFVAVSGLEDPAGAEELAQRVVHNLPEVWFDVKVSASGFTLYSELLAAEADNYLKTLENVVRLPGNAVRPDWWQEFASVFDREKARIDVESEDGGLVEVDRPVKFGEKILQTLRSHQEYPRARAMLEMALDAKLKAEDPKAWALSP